MNAQQELLAHIEGRQVKYISLKTELEFYVFKAYEGTLSEVLHSLDFKYDNGSGSQKLFGTIWYEDGTWSEREEYDVSEWWAYRSCPPLPDSKITDIEPTCEKFKH